MTKAEVRRVTLTYVQLPDAKACRDLRDALASAGCEVHGQDRRLFALSGWPVFRERSALATVALLRDWKLRFDAFSARIETVDLTIGPEGPELQSLFDAIPPLETKDEILVCGRTAELVKGEYLLRPSDLGATWQRLGKPRPRGRFAQALPLIGRDAAWRRLCVAWEQSCAGTGRHVVIRGEAGLGKTALTERLARHVRCDGSVLIYRCSPFWRERPLAPLGSGEAGIWLQNDELMATRYGAAWNELRQLLVAHQPIAPASGEARMELLRQLADAHQLLSEDRPLLLIVEDCHWIDPGTNEWLNILSRSIESSQMFLVVTSRPHSEWVLPENADCVELGGLSAADMQSLVTRELGDDSDPELASRIADLAEGVPLFARELAKSGIVKRREVGADGIEIPILLYESLMAPIESDPLHRRYLQAASCLGRIFKAEDVAWLLSVPPGGLDDTLRDLLDRNLLERVDSQHVAFHHALAREAAYRSVPQDQASSWHRTAAQRLKRADADIPDRLDRLLFHLEACGDQEGAIATGLEVIDRNLAQYDLATTDAAFRRVDALAAGTDIDLTQRLALAFRRSHWLYLSGRFEESAQCLETELPTLNRGQRPKICADCLLQLAHVLVRLARFGDAQNAAKRAFELAEPIDHREGLGRSLGTTCLIAALRGDLDGNGEAAGQSSIEHLAASGSHFWQGMSQFYLGMLAILQGRHGDAQSFAAATLTLGRDRHDMRLQCYGHFLAAWAASLAGDAKLARLSAEEALRQAPDPPSRAYAMMFVAHAAFEARRPDASKELEAAMHAMIAIGFRPFIGILGAIWADELRLLGEREQALRIVAQARVESLDAGYVLGSARVAWVEGKLAWPDQPQRARQQLMEARIILEDAHARFDLSRLLSDLAVVEAAIGEPAHAADLRNQALNHLEALGDSRALLRYRTGIEPL